MKGKGTAKCSKSQGPRASMGVWEYGSMGIDLRYDDEVDRQPPTVIGHRSSVNGHRSTVNDERHNFQQVND